MKIVEMQDWNKECTKISWENEMQAESWDGMMKMRIYPLKLRWGIQEKSWKA